MLEAPSRAGDGANVTRLELELRDRALGSVVLATSRYSLMELAVLGDVGGRSLIVSDAFPAYDGVKMCEASSERSVRVISVGGAHEGVRETFRRALERCDSRAQPTSLYWDAASRSLVIDGKPNAVDEEGGVTPKAMANVRAPAVEAPDASVGVGSVEVHASKNARGVTTFSFDWPGATRATIDVSYGDTTFGALDEMKVVGRAEDLVLVEESYPSRPQSPRSYCGAGTERFLHAFAIDGARVRETLRLTVESCFGNITTENVSWDASRRTLRLDWARLHPTEHRIYVFARNGNVMQSARTVK